MSGFNNLDTDTLLDMAIPDANPGNLTDQMLDKAINDARINSVDTLSGAPANVRAAVGAAQRPEDKLATLRAFYPNAERVESFDPKNGAARFGSGNFIYEDPETKQLMLFDEYNRIFGMPIPFTMKDLLDVGPEIAETAGAISGAIGGGALGATGFTAGPVGFTTTAAGIVAGEGLGAATAREAYITALDFFGETVDERSGMNRLLDFGITGIINAAAGPIIHKTFSGIKSYVGGPIRLEDGVNTPVAKNALESMEQIGITNPTAGQTTGNPLIQLTEKALAAMPLSTKIMQENAQQTVEEIGQFAATLTSKYGGARTFQQASEELISAAKAADARFVAKSNELYGEVGKFIPPNTNVSKAVGVSKFIDDYTARSELASLTKTYAPAMELAGRIAKDASEGKLTYQALRDVRTSLYNDLADPKFRGAMTGADRKLDELYGVITKDLDKLVADAGPEASAAYKVANDFTKGKLSEGTGSMAFVKEVIQKGKKDATNALDFALSKREKGGGRLLKLKEELLPEEWEILSGYMMGILGKPQARQAGATLIEEGAIDAAKLAEDVGFHPGQFVTNFGKLSPEAKQVLFGGDPELLGSLNNFYSVLKRIADDAVAMSNPSGTARLYGAMGMFSPSAIGAGMEAMGKGGAFYDGGFLSILAAPGAAKLMTSSRFVNWLGESIEKAAYDPQSLGQHVRRLVQIYQLEPAIRDQIEAVANGHIGELAEPNPNLDAQNVQDQAPEVTNELSFREVSNREVSDKLIGTQIPQLAEQITDFTMPTVADADRELAMSPTVLPDERDREITMREAGGIGSLV
jgi:hypothetical protein